MAMEQVPAPCGVPNSPVTARGWIVFDFKQLWMAKPSSNGGLHQDGEWPSEDLKFTMTPSWNGGFDSSIGSHIIRVPKDLSAQKNPFVQMVLFAACHVYSSFSAESVQDGSMFRCPKAFVPKCVLDMVNGSHSSAKGQQASEVSANMKLGNAGEDGGTVAEGARGGVSCEGTHDPKVSKLNEKDNGAPGSEPDKTDWQQQQQQQQQQDTLTGVNHVGAGNEEGCIPGPACQGKMETSSPINLGANSGDSGSVICETDGKIISGLAAAEHLNEQQHFPKDDAQHMQQSGNGVWVNSSSTQQKRAGHHGEQDDHSGRCGGPYVVTDENAISIAVKNNHAATACWLIASAVPHHATGNRDLVSGFAPVQGDLFVKTGDAGAAPMRVVGAGNVVTDAVVLPDVWYVPGLAANVVSVSQLAELEYSVAFGGGQCYVRSAEDGVVAGAARAGEDGLFALDFIRVPLGL